jgi:hypothetical protein
MPHERYLHADRAVIARRIRLVVERGRRLFHATLLNLSDSLKQRIASAL